MNKPSNYGSSVEYCIAQEECDDREKVEYADEENDHENIFFECSIQYRRFDDNRNDQNSLTPVTGKVEDEKYASKLIAQALKQPNAMINLPQRDNFGKSRNFRVIGKQFFYEFDIIVRLIATHVT